MKKIIAFLFVITSAIFLGSNISTAATVLFPYGGGTGTSTRPTYGQVLVGNNSSGYNLMSTSSLNIVSPGDGSFSTTSADFWYTLQDHFSTTSVDFWETTQQRWATTSSAYFASQGLSFSTSSSDFWKTQNNFFSTTSADYWSSLNLGWSTTSANYFAHSSTTIPKTYTANTFVGQNIFNASTTFNATTSVEKLVLHTDPSIGEFLAGKMYYDKDYNTVSVNVDGNVNLQMNEETVVYAEATENILNGEAVYMSGASGSYPTVTKAKADTSSTAYVLGVATQNITSGQKGFITVRGVIHDMNTSTWTSGDNLYLSTTTAGALVNFTPFFPDINARVGRVIVKDASVGSIFVNPRQLNQLSALTDVSIFSPQADQVLTYNGTGWINKAGTIGAGASVNEYFQQTESSVPGVLTLARSPQSGLGEVSSTSASVTLSTSPKLIKEFVASSDLDTTAITSGIWDFHTFALLSGGATAGVQFEVYASTTAGVQTLLFRTATTSGWTTSIGEVTVETVQPTFVVNSTDRLFVRVLATQTAAASRTVTFYWGGTTHYSFFSTPLQAKHNDLAGLQGGTASNYWHLSASEGTVTGSGGLVRLNAPTFTGLSTFANSTTTWGTITNLWSSVAKFVDSVTTGTTTSGAIELTTANTGIKFADGTYQYTAPVQGSGIASLNGQTGSTQTFATTTPEDANISLIITSTGDVHTFNADWTGTLAAARIGLLNGFADDTTLLGGDRFPFYEDAGGVNKDISWTNLMSEITDTGTLADLTVTATTTTGTIELTVANSGIKFQDGTFQYTAYTDGTASTFLNTKDKGYFFSTTSADAWSKLGYGWSTTSANAWSALNLGFSTSSAIYWADASTTIAKLYKANTWAEKQTFDHSSTTQGTVDTFWSTLGRITTGYFTTLYQNNHKVIPRWSDKMSIPSATSTDETAKFGSCLESGGPSVTIDKIDTHIASTSGGMVMGTSGIAWNLSIANTAGSTSPMTAFSSVRYSQGTTTIQSFTPDSTVTIPSGYCYWFAPTVASTSPIIQQFHFNIYGYEN